MKIINCFVLLVAVIFASCKKETVKPIPLTAGAFAGTFSYINPLIKTQVYGFSPISGDVTLTIKGQSYTCTSSVSFPNAAGSFSTTDQQIIFKDSTAHFADFDWAMILNGSYNSTTKGDSLFLVKTLNTGVYSFKLKKQ